MSTIKLAHRLILIITILALLNGILFLISYGIDPNMGCEPLSRFFKIYISSIEFSIVIGFLPISISSTFAILAYLNVRRIIRHQVSIFRRRLDRQLTAMVLIRVCLYVITNLPFIAYEIYQLNVSFNPNDNLWISIDQLAGAISFSIYFLNYSVFNL